MIELTVLYTLTKKNPDYKDVDDLYNGMDLENLGIEKPDDNKLITEKVWKKVSVAPEAIIYIEHYIGDDSVASEEGGGARIGLIEGSCFTVKESPEEVYAKVNLSLFG